MKEYDAYLFDADGTLIDTKELIFRSFLHMGEAMDAGALDHDLIRNTIGLPMARQLRLFLGEGRDEEYYARAGAAYTEFQMAHADDFLRAFPGSVETLRELRRRGKKLAVVTSRRLLTTKPFLEQLGLLEFFDLLVTPEDTEKHKPDPEPALLAMRRLGATPEKTVFIGDAVFDIQCGKAAGMDTIFVVWGGVDPSGWDVRPDWTVDRFDRILPERGAE